MKIILHSKQHRVTLECEIKTKLRHVNYQVPRPWILVTSAIIRITLVKSLKTKVCRDFTIDDQCLYI
jgi:hypothetical protein